MWGVVYAWVCVWDRLLLLCGVRVLFYVVVVLVGVSLEVAQVCGVFRVCWWVWRWVCLIFRVVRGLYLWGFGGFGMMILCVFGLFVVWLWVCVLFVYRCAY